VARIVHMTSVHPPFDTRILFRECATLARAGHDVTLVAAGEGEPEIQGVHMRYVARTSGRRGRMVQTAGAVAQRALALHADLYHVHDPELLPWAQWMRLRGARVVFDMHENLPGAILDKPWIRPRLRRPASSAARLAERALIGTMPVIFAEDSYRKYYPWVRQHATVLNMPDVARLAGYRTARRDKFTVAYIGGVGATRGSLTLLDALGALHASGLDLAYECVGPVTPQHSAQIQERMSALQLRDVNLSGRLPSDQGLRRIADCHVGVALLKKRPNYYESYPTKMFEYMALGLPVLVSDFPLYRAVVEGEGCGICVDPDDPGAIAAALRLLHDAPDLAAAMGERGRCAAQERYNWAVEGQKLVAFYEGLLPG
jgi:glycosyltransferase involved in cell wall biosynthesis